MPEQLPEIALLHEQEAAGEVDVYYFDESGFSLTPEVPYAWQAVGETIEIPSRRSTRLNVLGFINTQQDFHATTVQGYVDSEIVVTAFDHFEKMLLLWQSRVEYWTFDNELPKQVERLTN